MVSSLVQTDNYLCSGEVGEFPVIWLRDTSLDEKTYSIGPAMKARWVSQGLSLFLPTYLPICLPVSLSLAFLSRCISLSVSSNLPVFRNLVMRTFDVTQSPLSLKLENNELLMEWPGEVKSRYCFSKDQATIYQILFLLAPRQKSQLWWS